MGDFGRATVAVAAGSLVTFLMGNLLGLNSWLNHRIHRTWNIPGYGVLFSVLLVTGAVGVLMLSRRRRWNMLSVMALGVAVGYLSGVISYLLAPLIFGSVSLSEYKAAAAFGSILGFVGLALLIPAVLLSWLYGGLVLTFSVLATKIPQLRFAAP